MNESIKLYKTERIMRSLVKHYNPDKYWKYRERVLESNSRFPKILRLYWLFYIKRCDAFNNASFGTHLGYGAVFDEPPILPHGLNGIIISHHAHVGKNCTIYHDVTIGNGHEGGRCPQHRR